MKNHSNTNTWSTDNFLVKWSLRTGTLIIGYIAMIGLGLTTAVFSWMTYTCWGVYLHNCTAVPEPERMIVQVVTSDDYEFNVEVILSLCVMFFGTYFFMSFLVIVGTYVELAKLLKGWVHCTMMLMILVVTDLVITLAFTSLSHLATLLSLFVISLYTWAVVRSHMIVLKIQHYAHAQPLKKFTNYTPHAGLNLDELVEEARV